jgi:hypothetical protein
MAEGLRPRARATPLTSCHWAQAEFSEVTARPFPGHSHPHNVISQSQQATQVDATSKVAPTCLLMLRGARLPACLPMLCGAHLSRAG